ncbi:unnamed protein product [Owenia fusiformis]|uniref:Uncharacterized protein n=1 Tax=Owenia fusiformis TaxID=6347 RepID=A0A8S4N4P2_OWEFU|nr:unnamed protein product [Owenia fusiformis]
MIRKITDSITDESDHRNLNQRLNPRPTVYKADDDEHQIITPEDTEQNNNKLHKVEATIGEEIRDLPLKGKYITMGAKVMIQIVILILVLECGQLQTSYNTDIINSNVLQPEAAISASEGLNTMKIEWSTLMNQNTPMGLSICPTCMMYEEALTLSTRILSEAINHVHLMMTYYILPERANIRSARKPSKFILPSGVLLILCLGMSLIKNL